MYGDETIYVNLDSNYIKDPKGYKLITRNSTSLNEYTPMTSSVK